MDKEYKLEYDSTVIFSSGQEILRRDYVYVFMVMKITSHQLDKLLSCMAPPENICENRQRILMLFSST